MTGRPFPKLGRYLAALAILVASAGGVRAADCADLALVLAIDGSGSIRTAEFALQQEGYARAFRSARVQAALAAAGAVDIGVVIWGDTEIAPQVMPPVRIADSADAEALSRRLAEMPRRVSGNTGIGTGLSTAIDLLDAPGTCAQRRIVNLSGDGLETISPRARLHVPLAKARARAEALGITINALAIRTEVPDLDLWYAQRLIAGPGAFVMEVAGYDSFAEAIEEKLVREIAPLAVAALSDDARTPPREARHLR